MIGVFFFINGYYSFIYTSRRIGRNGIPFTLYKFKTLSDETYKSLQERQFRYGRFLRNTSLDELPQLWNILIGNMSFVGPRPLPVEYLPYFTKEQQKRFEVNPGLTGWAQVNGRTTIDWDKKLSYDLEYVERQSFFFDTKILFLTLKVLFFEKNNKSLEETSLIDYVNCNK